MVLYTRPQLVVLLAGVVVAGVGLGVGHWRRTHPELTARLEALDRPRVPSPAPGEDGGATVPSPAEQPPVSGAEARSRAEPRSRAAADPASWPARPGTSPPEHRPPKGMPPARPLDVNRATEDELRTLPGIGGVLAARIVQTRERDGPFASLDDLRRVPGLGRGKLQRIAAAVALPP